MEKNNEKITSNKNARFEESDASSVESDSKAPQNKHKQKNRKVKMSEIDQIEKQSDNESEKRSSAPTGSKKGRKSKKGCFGNFFGWFDQKRKIIRTATRKHGMLSAAGAALLIGR